MKKRKLGNLIVGRAEVKPSSPSHVAGVREGNRKGSAERTPGLARSASGLRGSARRSTGINPRDRDPIDPRMPNISPA